MESNGLSRSQAWGHKMTFHDLISLNLMSYCMTTFIFQGNACICIERQNLCWKICLTTIYRSSNLLSIAHISIPDMIAATWYTLHHDKSFVWGFEQPNDIIFIVDHHSTFCCLDVVLKMCSIEAIKSSHCTINRSMQIRNYMKDDELYIVYMFLFKVAQVS